MSRPVLFVIDDDAGVIRTLQDNLGRRFGEDLLLDQAGCLRRW